MDNSKKNSSPSAIADQHEGWVEGSRHKLLFYDLVASFGPSDEPKGERRIVAKGRRSERILGRSAWDAGDEAVNALRTLYQVGEDSGGRDLTIEELEEALPGVREQAENFLDLTFYPDFKAMLGAGRICVDIPLESADAVWPDLALISKVEMFLELLEATRTQVPDEDLSDFMRRVAAIAVLAQLDECALAYIDGSKNDGEKIIRVERMRRFVRPSEPATLDFGKLQRLALSDLNTKLAQRRHKKTNDARDWIREEWAAHAEDYQGNKSEFSRHYTRRLMNEKQVKVTEKTMREVWLHNAPSAGKPACLPADGE
ncbi:hypothetical protein [Ottowia testudinis]|uniref:Uncharacterized protein n=1 Tax=Ottowia testudinis TaxID=2816950 RepID=A0A975CDQ7_9BURK|nr:hypothetical protein [Ottowia testudinis]QTD44573.1 hypothetical protein J1M35_15955 [Ottowia testudinis]